MMRPFEKSEEATLTQPASKRLEAFHKAVWDALVPANGECISVQGELVRARDRIASEYYRDGMSNYYSDPFEESYHGRLLMFMLGALIENRSGGLDPEDVAYFVSVRDRVPSDSERALRIRALEDGEEPMTAEEEKEYDALEAEARSSGIHWEELANRAERCIANWCIANPKLIDRSGKSIEERKIRDLNDVFEPPLPPPKCPLCQGRGFIQPKDPTKFPERCSCTGPDPRTRRF